VLVVIEVHVNMTMKYCFIDGEDSMYSIFLQKLHNRVKYMCLQKRRVSMFAEKAASNAFICLFTKQIRKRITTAKTYAGFLHIRRDDYCRKMARPVMEKIVIQFQFPLKSQLKLVV